MDPLFFLLLDFEYCNSLVSKRRLTIDDHTILGFYTVFYCTHSLLFKFLGITVKSLFVTAAAIEIDEFLAQNLLSKNHILLRLLFKGGYYLKAATNKDFTVYECIH